MRCQLHLDVEAAAICVSCGRALCRECQKTTRDERMICGLPQCEDFVIRQKAVQFAIRQSCANNAETRVFIGNVLRWITWILLVPSVILTPFAIVAVTFGLWGFTRNDVVAIVVPVVYMILACVLLRVRKGLLAQAQNWDDISREFDRPADFQGNGPNEGDNR